MYTEYHVPQLYLNVITSGTVDAHTLYGSCFLVGHGTGEARRLSLAAEPECHAKHAEATRSMPEKKAVSKNWGSFWRGCPSNKSPTIWSVSQGP